MTNSGWICQEPFQINTTKHFFPIISVCVCQCVHACRLNSNQQSKEQGQELWTRGQKTENCEEKAQDWWWWTGKLGGQGAVGGDSDTCVTPEAIHVMTGCKSSHMFCKTQVNELSGGAFPLIIIHIFLHLQQTQLIIIHIFLHLQQTQLIIIHIFLHLQQTQLIIIHIFLHLQQTQLIIIHIFLHLQQTYLIIIDIFLHLQQTWQLFTFTSTTNLSDNYSHLDLQQTDKYSHLHLQQT